MIPVLDHGYVRLIDVMGNDLAIVQAARHSHDAAWRAGENEGSDTRLIHYLMRHRHTSPFEQVEFKFEVRCPVFVARQWHRHRTWSYNEISGRYTELPEQFYVPGLEVVGTQSRTNKQGRELSDVERTASVASYEARCRASYREYEWLLGQGWPRELARGVLPLSTYTGFFAKVDLHNLLHFIELRLDDHAQYEIRKYAQALLELIEPVVPVTIEAWRVYRCPRV